MNEEDQVYKNPVRNKTEIIDYTIVSKEHYSELIKYSWYNVDPSLAVRFPPFYFRLKP